MENKTFQNWKNQWEKPEQMGSWSYISFNIHPDNLLIVGELFFPKMVEVEDYVFFEEKFDEASFQNWKTSMPGDTNLEKIINHIHIYDLFENCSDEIEEATFIEIANLLKTTWDNFFKIKFPTRKIVVELTNYETDYGPTIMVYQFD